MEVHSLFPTPVGSFPLSKLSRDKLHLLLQQPKKTNEGNRTYTFMDLSIKYDISERQAQSIVYKERKKESHTQNITL